MVDMGTIAKPSVYRIAAVQLVAAGVLSALIVPFGGVASYSFLTGCLIQIAGNAYFARLAYRYQGARQVKAMVQAMYLGESGKILISAVLFATAFVLIKPLSAVSVFVGYISMLVVHVLAAAGVLKRKPHIGK